MIRELHRQQELRKAAIERWAEATDQTTPSPVEDYERTHQPHLTQHVYIPPDAFRHIAVRSALTYPQIDTVVDLICSAVAKRLPRRLDAYHFVDDKAHDSLTVPGLGDLAIEIARTGGVFHFIREVRGSEFSIRNCRDAGRIFGDEWIDGSCPSTITVAPLDLTVNLYNDDSGVFVVKGDVTYASDRSDSTCDDCTIAFDYESKNPTLLKIKKQFGWGIPDADRDTVRDILQVAGVPETVHFPSESIKLVDWLRDAVLLPVATTPRVLNQITEKPLLPPFPAAVGALHTWLREEDAERLVRSNGEVERLRTDERYAAEPSLRLIPLGVRGDFPSEAHEGFVWCGFGAIDADAEVGDFAREVLLRGTGSRKAVLGEVHPKNGDRIWVVDLEPLERHGWFAVARSMIPVGEYRGNYKQPLALVARNLEVDEVVVTTLKYDPYAEDGESF
jgi:hypothetical protein